MKFDIYFPFKNKAGVMCPGVKPNPMAWHDILILCNSKEQRDLIEKIRSTEDKKELAELKKSVPAICVVGRCTNTRAIRYMQPTGLYMIDIDHIEMEPIEAYREILNAAGEDYFKDNVLAAHITVGGKGLRFFLRAQEGFKDLIDNMNDFAMRFEIAKYGKYDAPCKDFSRISFLPLASDFLYQNEALFGEDDAWNDGYLVNNWETTESEKPDGQLFSESETLDTFTDDEKREFDTYDYKGTLVRTIIEKWVEVKGAPGKGEIHNYYNDMVKNFRNIVSNNKRCLLYLLPRFGHTASECWSSIVSICKVNTLSTLPKPFFFFLKDNGFYKTGVNTHGALAEYMLAEAPETEDEKLPWMPPIFREFVKIAPADFKPSVVNALLPIMGTLTSYLQAPYYYDGRMHTSSFFSVIYAPPGTGKGFVERMVNILFEDLRIRDYVQNARYKIYLNILNRKGDNEKSPEDPHTSLRIIPAKNSETEFLSKQQDNHGYHMFTYAPEMDSWAKGVRAAGGNKDDMIRIAWDNGEYGQQYKSAGTFKGTVNLYWNVLITGTIQQLLSYFKNVENGLITRCSFTTIENQEFAEPPVWKALSKSDMNAIRKFMDRCDRNTYKDPCTLGIDEIDSISPAKFDEEVDWQFQFQPRKTIDMEWLRPTIEKFLKEQMQKAALDLDKARDVFRRRVAVRGFRLGIICHALWEHPKRSDLEKCIPFIEWWMQQDLEGNMKLWGSRYNSEAEEAPNLYNRSIFAQLSEAFTNNDVYALCARQGIKTPVRQIIYQWNKLKYIKKIGKGEYEKITKK